eukprot:tig00000133_g7707.t1
MGDAEAGGGQALPVSTAHGSAAEGGFQLPQPPLRRRSATGSDNADASRARLHAGAAPLSAYPLNLATASDQGDSVRGGRPGRDNAYGRGGRGPALASRDAKDAGTRRAQYTAALLIFASPVLQIVPWTCIDFGQYDRRWQYIAFVTACAPSCLMFCAYAALMFRFSPRRAVYYGVPYFATCSAAYHFGNAALVDAFPWFLDAPLIAIATPSIWFVVSGVWSAYFAYRSFRRATRDKKIFAAGPEAYVGAGTSAAADVDGNAPVATVFGGGAAPEPAAPVTVAGADAFGPGRSLSTEFEGGAGPSVNPSEALTRSCEAQQTAPALPEVPPGPPVLVLPLDRPERASAAPSPEPSAAARGGRIRLAPLSLPPSQPSGPAAAPAPPTPPGAEGQGQGLRPGPGPGLGRPSSFRAWRGEAEGGDDLEAAPAARVSPAPIVGAGAGQEARGRLRSGSADAAQATAAGAGAGADRRRRRRPSALVRDGHELESIFASMRESPSSSSSRSSSRQGNTLRRFGLLDKGGEPPGAREALLFLSKVLLFLLTLCSSAFLQWGYLALFAAYTGNAVVQIAINLAFNALFFVLSFLFVRAFRNFLAPYLHKCYRLAMTFRANGYSVLAASLVTEVVVLLAPLWVGYSTRAYGQRIINEVILLLRGTRSRAFRRRGPQGARLLREDSLRSFGSASVRSASSGDDVGDPEGTGRTPASGRGRQKRGAASWIQSFVRAIGWRARTGPRVADAPAAGGATSTTSTLTLTLAEATADREEGEEEERAREAVAEAGRSVFILQVRGRPAPRI